MRIFILLLLSITYINLSAQVSYDSTIAFQTDPAKIFAVYVPSSYTPGTPNRVMVGLHPFNTSRWDAISWKDTLTDFAETNGLILVCPDGGADGQVDDAIDTTFTTAILDSVKNWYTVDNDKIYAMGFSWGAKTTYTYGLTRPDIYAGYLPIGAAVSIGELNSTMLFNSKDKPVYLVHGGNDSPGTRFTPIRQALIDSGAIVNSLLMPGVGHTIDFPSRNDILTTAFQWIDSVNCAATATSIEVSLSKMNGNVYPNPILQGQSIIVDLDTDASDLISLAVLDQNGQLIQSITQNGNKIALATGPLPVGMYILKAETSKGSFTRKIIIQ